MKAAKIFALLFLAVLALRLCHARIVWAEEQLPLAAAMQMARGQALYRDIWFDKPPLAAGVYLLWGARFGWPLRLAGGLFVTLACLLAWRFARDLWGEREAWLAAGLLAFFLCFGLPAAVIPLAADWLLLAPHLAAVYLASRRRWLGAGLLAGTGLLFNAKAVLVLAACAIWLLASPKSQVPSPKSQLSAARAWCFRLGTWDLGLGTSQLGLGAWDLGLLLVGFAIPNLLALGWFAAHGSLHDCILQVWRWGSIYAGNTFLEHPWQTGLLRTANWAGFHIALIAGAGWFFFRTRDIRFAAWMALSFAGVVLGLRFFPRYYLLLLPAFTLAAARGYALMAKKRAAIVLVLALLAPFVRFAPRYALLARDLAAGRPHQWSDVVMYQDSQAAAKGLRAMASPGDTIFVWGYRPDIYIYSGLPAGTRFLESQPLSGVLADRHLFQSGALAPELAALNRRELIRSRPQFVIDGLGPYNAVLAIENYPDLREWLAGYEVVSRTRSTIIYRRRSAGSPGRFSEKRAQGNISGYILLRREKESLCLFRTTRSLPKRSTD